MICWGAAAARLIGIGPALPVDEASWTLAGSKASTPDTRLAS